MRHDAPSSLLPSCYVLSVRVLLLVVLVVAAALAAVGMLATSEYGRASGLLVRAARLEHPLPRLAAGWQASEVTTRERSLPSRRGSLRARVYTPAVVRTRPLLLLGGIHALGIDEPRLRHFATEIARSGTVVVTPELPDLLSYLITARLTDDIEDAALALARETAAASPGEAPRIAMLGVSFSGGLAIVAAGRPALRDHVGFVFSFGGHASLTRVLRYLATGQHPAGEVAPPHDYGGVVLLMNAADLLVPPDQVPLLREGLGRFLHASHVAMFDAARADREFEDARLYEQRMPAETRRLLHLVNTRDTEGIGTVLLPHVLRRRDDVALSPELAPAPSAPVYLLHAEGDNIIPTPEAMALSTSLRARGTSVRMVTTGLLAHAEVRRTPGVREVVDLVRFWAEMPW